MDSATSRKGPTTSRFITLPPELTWRICLKTNLMETYDFKSIAFVFSDKRVERNLTKSELDELSCKARDEYESYLSSLLTSGGLDSDLVVTFFHRIVLWGKQFIEPKYELVILHADILDSKNRSLFPILQRNYNFKDSSSDFGDFLLTNVIVYGKPPNQDNNLPLESYLLICPTSRNDECLPDIKT